MFHEKVKEAMPLTDKLRKTTDDCIAYQQFFHAEPLRFFNQTKVNYMLFFWADDKARLAYYQNVMHYSAYYRGISIECDV